VSATTGLMQLPGQQEDWTLAAVGNSLMRLGSAEAIGEEDHLAVLAPSAVAGVSAAPAPRASPSLLQGHSVHGEGLLLPETLKKCGGASPANVRSIQCTPSTSTCHA
jgi:hypothetical protein